MQGSRLIAAVLTVGIIGGSAFALTKGGESSAVNAQESLCSNASLTMSEQDSCKAEMKAATTHTAKQQVAVHYESKIYLHEALANSGANTQTKTP